MTFAVKNKADSGWKSGSTLGRFLSAGILLLVLIGSTGVKKASAATCPALPDMNLPRLQGTVYGPSGVTVPQILVEVLQDGKQVGQTHTGEHGKFQLKVKPGDYVVHIQFLGSRSIDLKVRVGHISGDLFHTTRMRLVLGLSGAKCNFATTSSKELKNELRRYEQRLVEVPPGP